MLFRALLCGTLLLPSATAWFKDVHQQIGFMAETFLTPATTTVIHHILEPQYNGSIGRAAAWADDYAHTAEGHFSYQWHWIDSSDDLPTHCNVCYDHDCAKGGCVVQAIANQTNILEDCIAQAKDGTLTGGVNLTCSYALKWVAHFLGDITQPLHASRIAAGGNLFNVTFGNLSTDLHAVWDGYIIYSDASVSGFSNVSLSPFMADLVSRIRSDSFFEPTASWLACSDPSTPLECALNWARESNTWTCNYVYSQAYNHTDLSTSGYATGAYPIVELQISKAALRLGTWLNKLVAIDHKNDRDMVLQMDPAWISRPHGAN